MRAPRTQRKLARGSHGSMLGIALAVALAGCGDGVPRPAELVLDEEECSLCRMAVSRRPFAAQAVIRSGAVHFFDDIGCLARWTVEQPPPQGTALFVVDHATGAWIDAAAARYVRAARLETPMGSGLAAFASEERAREEARNLGGTVIDWPTAVAEASP